MAVHSFVDLGSTIWALQGKTTGKQPVVSDSLAISRFVPPRGSGPIRFSRPRCITSATFGPASDAGFCKWLDRPFLGARQRLRHPAARMDDEPHSSKRIKLEHSPSLDDVIQQPQLQDEVQSLDEDHCSICLHSKADTTVIPTCSHEFCFECILIWTEQSRKCPLCSQAIGDYLIHRIRSNYDYQKHFLPPLRTSPRPSAPAQVHGRGRSRNLPRRDRRWGQRARQASGEADQLERAVARRRWIYSHLLYAKHVASNSFTRYRPFPTPAQFASSPDLISRMTAFLRRELRVWPDLDIEFLTTFTISLMKSIDIRSESAIKLVAEFLDMDAPYIEGNRHENAEHFAHEIYCYLRSPFRDLNVYDSAVQYDIPADLAPPVEPDRSHRWREGRLDLPVRRAKLAIETVLKNVTFTHTIPHALTGSSTQTRAEDNIDRLQRAKDKGKAREHSVDQLGQGYGDELSCLVSRDPHLRAMDVSDKPVSETRLTPKGEAVTNADSTISTAATGPNGDPIDSVLRATLSGHGREPSAALARLTTEGRRTPRHSTLRQLVEAHLSRSGSAAEKESRVNDRVAQPAAGRWHERLRHGDGQPNHETSLKLSPTQSNVPSLLARLSDPPPGPDNGLLQRSTRLSPPSYVGSWHEADPGLTLQFGDEDTGADEHGMFVPNVMSQTPQPGTSHIQQHHGVPERLSTVRTASSHSASTPMFPLSDSASFLVDKGASLGGHNGDTFLVDDNSLLPSPYSSSQLDRRSRLQERLQAERGRGRLGPHDEAVSETRFQRVVPRQAPCSPSQGAGAPAPPPIPAADSAELSCRERERNASGPSPFHSDSSLKAGRRTPSAHAGGRAAGSTAIIRAGDDQAAGSTDRRYVASEGTSGGIVHGGDGDGDATTSHREQALRASLVGRRT
ncbi:hypothetical protein CONPUDRAFT_75758 [Coniophora puteana RWD-64-598 SS2]|uniref:RING-type E3 ubiquitin transferase n=1 Tax=Coniophora puteana (strain RWD-64-598) TaxID=741705 RepID=A0A5M3MFH8_CONPW|nr:uncharacterized protein CONPUDRAFT_75758 [Coniophora puteana RWD-64-598 SS2]EIW78019.1 hypothetical protein CONPUDRAFT_75758 [Coniophora puteana RWD-64-598 SS2]